MGEAPAIQAYLIEIVSRVERSVTEKLEHAAVQRVRAGARDQVGISRRAVPDLGQHNSRTRLNFLDSVYVEVGKRSPTHLGIGGVHAIHGKNGGRTTLPIDRKLLREIRGPVRVRHRAGGQQQELAEIARVERQTGNLGSGKTLTAARLRKGSALFLHKNEALLRS